MFDVCLPYGEPCAEPCNMTVYGFVSDISDRRIMLRLIEMAAKMDWQMQRNIKRRGLRLSCCVELMQVDGSLYWRTMGACIGGRSGATEAHTSNREHYYNADRSGDSGLDMK